MEVIVDSNVCLLLIIGVFKAGLCVCLFVRHWACWTPVVLLVWFVTSSSTGSILPIIADFLTICHYSVDLSFFFFFLLR